MVVEVQGMMMGDMKIGHAGYMMVKEKEWQMVQVMMEVNMEVVVMEVVVVVMLLLVVVESSGLNAQETLVLRSLSHLGQGFLVDGMGAGCR